MNLKKIKKTFLAIFLTTSFVFAGQSAGPDCGMNVIFLGSEIHLIPNDPGCGGGVSFDLSIIGWNMYYIP
jgi:hypothetical protein